MTFDTKTTCKMENGVMVVRDEQGEIIETATRTTIVEKMEQERHLEQMEEIGFLKKIVELTYKDGKNTKAIIRNMANKRLDHICS